MKRIDNIQKKEKIVFEFAFQFGKAVGNILLGIR